MKVIFTLVWAGLVAEVAHATVLVPGPALLAIPEPSTVVMLVLGACAIGVGVLGVRRRPQ